MQNSNCNISKREFIKRSFVVSAGLLSLPCQSFISAYDKEQQRIYRKIAMFQEETERGIICRLCPNGCVLDEGELSRCKNRKVKDSKLYTLAYGNPCAVNVDPVEKKPLYHFLPGSRAFSIATAGCNFACLNCQNWTISQTGPEKTRNFDMMPEKVVDECMKNECRSIAYTYSEPTTFYEYVFETATAARKAGIKNIVKSNGYINPEPLKKLCSVIDAANIDLKAFNEATYRRLSGGRLQPVLESLKIYRDMGVWLEITNLVVPSWSDDLSEIRKMCSWFVENGFSKTPVHFNRFYPIHKLEQLPPTSVDVLNKAAQIASDEGMKFVYTGNAPGNERSNTVCPSCKATILVRQGYTIASNAIKGNLCSKCGSIIEGIWS